MSNRKALIFKRLIVVSAGVITVSLTAANYIYQQHQSSVDVSKRLPSSYQIRNIFRPKIDINSSTIHRTFKLDVPVMVTIAKEGSLSIEPGEPFVLRGSYKFSTANTNATIKWSLPKGVEVLRGIAEETITNVASNTPYESEIVLMTTSETNLKIHFSVGARSGSQRFSHSAQFNTTLQESINIDNEELAQRAAEYHKTVGNPQPKVLK